MLRVRSIVLLVSGCVLTVFAAASARSSSPVNPAEDAVKHAMDDMNSALKALSSGVTAENKDASLEELSKFESAIIAAKSHEPESAAKIDEKKRPAFVAEFRKTLLDALKTACDAEAAIADGKYKDADKLIKNKLGAMKSAGHSKFKPEGG